MLHGKISDLQIPESIRWKHWKRRTLGSDAFLTRDRCSFNNSFEQKRTVFTPLNRHNSAIVKNKAKQILATRCPTCTTNVQISFGSRRILSRGLWNECVHRGIGGGDQSRED